MCVDRTLIRTLIALLLMGTEITIKHDVAFGCEVHGSLQDIFEPST